MRHISTFAAYRGAHALGLFLAFTGFAIVAFGCGLAWGADETGGNDPEIPAPEDGPEPECWKEVRKRTVGVEQHLCTQDTEGADDDADGTIISCTVYVIETFYWQPAYSEPVICPQDTVERIVECPACPEGDLPLTWTTGFNNGPACPLNELGQ